MNLAKQIALIGGAWIGWPAQCLATVSEACTASRLASLRDACLCNFTQLYSRGSLVLGPSAWIRNRAARKLAQITLNGPTGEEVWWVVDAVLQGLNHGLAVEEAWIEGAAMAVTLRDMALEGLAPWPIKSCDHSPHTNALHVCPGCWLIRVCSDFVESRFHAEPICKSVMARECCAHLTCRWT